MIGATGRPRPLPATGTNHGWAYDFLFDACANGQQLKCLTVIDEYTRECLAIDVAGSIRSGRVIEVLAKLVSVHGAPKYLRSDNGPEFICRAVLRWLTEANIDTAFIDPGKPWQNGLNESFNGKFRDECLSMQWFKNRIDAKILIEEFRREFNEVRPHSSLGQLTPAEFKRKLSTTNPETSASSMGHCNIIYSNRNLEGDVMGRRGPAGLSSKEGGYRRSRWKPVITCRDCSGFWSGIMDQFVVC